MEVANFKLERVTQEKEYILKNLLEYYLYDFNLFYEDDLNENGKFEFIETSDYISKENYTAFFIKIKNHYVGFALINDNVELAKQPAMRIEEFWIMPKYRKGLFAFKVLQHIFSMYDGEKEFIILKDNERYLKIVDYLINKHYSIVSTSEIVKWEDVKFKEYVII